VRAFGYSNATALTISASLAQIGEFSFILANLGVDLQLLPEPGRDLILAGAIISIILNPFLFSALDWISARQEIQPAKAPSARASEAGPRERGEGDETGPREMVEPTSLKNHVVLVGHGRVGRAISAALRAQKAPLFVIEDDEEAVAALKQQGIEALAGNAADPEMIAAANLPAARCLLVAIADGFEGGQVVEQARATNPGLAIIARAHSDEEMEHLKRHGATIVVMGEHEIAKSMLDNIAEAAPKRAKPRRRARS
ncbi:MAG TPA: NAD-binding protein, partial [Methyloceanibacter sp.]|nr:NAD-binding protein [Methyloceanibacter sp.]